MFLAGVEENEVTNIVRSCKNKKSTGYDNVDMVIVKKVISNIVVPFTHICNKSFSSGVFPSKMKVTKASHHNIHLFCLAGIMLVYRHTYPGYNATT